jgi:Fe2+ or Zn2+ uptake regulation protein
MPTAAVDPSSLRIIMEDAGLRCTPQRLAVYDRLTRASHHPTAEEVYRSVRTDLPRISLATVYKALETLVATGVATKLTAGEGDSGARYDARCDRHYHFRCLKSGTVHDLPTTFDPDLIAKLDPALPHYLDRQGYHVVGYRLEILGYQHPPVLESIASGEPAPAGAPEPGGHPPGEATTPKQSPALPVRAPANPGLRRSRRVPKGQGAPGP